MPAPAFLGILHDHAAEFAATRQTEARLRVTRDQLQVYFNWLLVASAGSDLGQKLMSLVLSDGMLKTAAATGEITVAQQEFIGELSKFIKSCEAWTKFADDPGGWGRSKLLGQAQEDLVGEENQQVIDAALEMFSHGQVLADAIGQRDGTAAQEYIEKNLGALGPLIPEYAFSKARQYVEVTQQWSEATKSMARLAGEGVSLASQIAEADLGIKVREEELRECMGG